MITIVDYGVGNLRSVEKAFHKLGHAAEVTADPEVIRRAKRVVLPGVGAFGAAIANLTHGHGDRPALLSSVLEAARSGRPFLGICVGMQLLLSQSEEMGRHAGLDLVPGRVKRLPVPQDDPDLKIPHIGWNALRFPRCTPLFAGIEAGASVYFVHSFYCAPEDPDVVAATAVHGSEFCAALGTENVFATQFHPEKSGAVGLRILDNFARL